MQLTGRQVAQIRDALLAAYSKDSLRELVRVELDENLESIAGGDNLRIVVFNLVSWAEQHGRIDALIAGAYSHNRQNATLQQLVQDAESWRTQAMQQAAQALPNAAPVAITPIATTTVPPGAGGPASIDVFLSYSRSDSAAMRAVYDILHASGLSVWIDEGLAPGTPSWTAAVQEAIAQAAAFVVLLSPAAQASTWVNNEIGYAQMHRKPCFPLLVAGDAASVVPISLVNTQWIDGRGDLAGAVAQHLAPALAKPPTSTTSPASPTPPELPPAAQQKGRSGLVAVGVAAIAIALGFALYQTYPWQGPLTPGPIATAEPNPMPTAVAISAPAPAPTATLAPAPTPAATPAPTPTGLATTMPRSEPLLTLIGHEDSVAAVAFNPDGDILASGSWDDTARLWDVQTGELLRTLDDHTMAVYAVAFSADGETLASGSEDTTIRLWQVGTGELRNTLEGHTYGVTSVAYSADGATLASGSWDNTARLWDARTGKLLHVLKGHDESVTSVAFSLDGGTLASGGEDFTVRLWDVQKGELWGTLEGHSGVVTSVAFAPDGAVVASGSEDGTIRLWDVATGETQRTLDGDGGAVYSVAFGSGGATLAGGSADGAVRQWDVHTGELLRAWHGATGAVRAVAFSPDGGTLAGGGQDGTVSLWRVAGD